MNEWISVKDQLPKHMQEVRVRACWPGGEPTERSKSSVWLAFTGSFYDSEEQTQLDFITHWMPLPEPENE